jgi:peptidoglycan/xylan/chitin deacetylase (PgdA/CDA1 family)
LDAYDPAQLELFYSRLGEITPYSDFSQFALDDPRLYYDASGHFRNSVGQQMLASLYGDGNGYPNPLTVSSRECKVWMYHHIVQEGETNGVVMTLADFRSEMELLRDSGYTTVSISDLIAYVDKGVDLPEKAILIRFDDGYLSNYELAFPVLKEFGFQAAIFAIGVSVGHTEYKDTQTPMTPHFNAQQAYEMVGSGLVEIQSHTYDMHQEPSLDGENCRTGLLKMAGESETDYVTALRGDITRSRFELEAMTKSPVSALAYPYGVHDLLAEVVLAQLGIRATFTTETGINTIVKGLPQSLFNLKNSEHK